MDASPRLPRPAAYSGDFEYEDKAPPPPPPPQQQQQSSAAPRRPHAGSTSYSAAGADPRSPLRTRHSEPELFGSPRDVDEYPRFEARKRMSADFSDDTMSVGSIGGESPKSDRGSWRLHSAVAGPFLTGPLAKDFQSEHLKTPRGKARDDINFDYSGLLFPLAPVIDAIPDTPRGGYSHQAQSFTDISQFENSSTPMDGFNLDGGSGYAANGQAARRGVPAAFQTHNGQFYAASGSAGYDAAQQHAANGQFYSNGSAAAAQQSSALVASHSHAHASSYADVVARNGGATSEQSLVSSTGTELESLSKGMADSMAQILAKTQNGRSYNEVQLTSLMQKIHLHMNVMGRTSAAIREDYNRIKAKLEQTITDKKVLEATSYHLQQLVQQYEVERQYFHQYVLHSLQSQSSLIYESMGNLSQNVEQSKSTIEELGARLSRELANIQGSRGNDSQLKDILEEIKRVVDASAITGVVQANGTQASKAPARSPQGLAKSVESDSKRVEEVKSGGFRLTPVLLAVLLWIATLGGVYISAKSAALSELQQQQQEPAPSLPSILLSDLDLLVHQISQKLESTVPSSVVREFVYTELKQNPGFDESVGVDEIEKDVPRETPEQHAEHKEEKIEPKSHQPEIPAPSQPSVPVPIADIEEPKSVITEAPREESPSKVEDETTPIEPAVETPSLPATSTPEVVPEIKEEVVEVEVPPTDQFQEVTTAAIAEMLRLNGLPVGAIPFDTLPGVVLPPTDASIESTKPAESEKPATNENPAEPFAEDVTIAGASKDASNSSVEAESGVADAEVGAPVVGIDAAAAESSVKIVEITIENSLNPDVIVQEEPPVTTNTTSAAVEPTVVEEAATVDDTQAPIKPDGTSSTEPREPKVIQPIEVVEDLPALIEIEVPTAEAPVIEVPTTEAPVIEVPTAEAKNDVVTEDPSDETASVAPTKLIQPAIATGGEDMKDKSADGDVKTGIPSIESAEADPTTVSTDPQTEPVRNDESKDVVSVDAVPSTKGAVAESTVEDGAQVTEDVHGATREDSDAGSVLDTITGLSKALRSLAHRFVDGGDISGEETGSEADQVADRELSAADSGVKAPAAVDSADDENHEANDVAGVANDAKDQFAAEPVAFAAEPSVGSVEAVEPISTAAVVINNSIDAVSESGSDVVTVEVTAGGDVGTDLSALNTLHDTPAADVDAEESKKSTDAETSTGELVVHDDEESKSGTGVEGEAAVHETTTAVPAEAGAGVNAVGVEAAKATEEDNSVEIESDVDPVKDAESVMFSTDAGSVDVAATSNAATEELAESKSPKELAVVVVDADEPVDSVAESHVDGKVGADIDETKSSFSSDASALSDAVEVKEIAESLVDADSNSVAEDAVAIADEKKSTVEKVDATTEAKSPTDESQAEQVMGDAASEAAVEIDADAAVVAVDAESPSKAELVVVDESSGSEPTAVDGAIGSVDDAAASSAAASVTSSVDAATSSDLAPTESELAKESDPVTAAVIDSNASERVAEEDEARPSAPSADATSEDEAVVAQVETVYSVEVPNADDTSKQVAGDDDGDDARA